MADHARRSADRKAGRRARTDEALVAGSQTAISFAFILPSLQAGRHAMSEARSVLELISRQSSPAAPIQVSSPDEALRISRLAGPIQSDFYCWRWTSGCTSSTPADPARSFGRPGNPDRPGAEPGARSKSRRDRADRRRSRSGFGPGRYRLDGAASQSPSRDARRAPSPASDPRIR